MISFERVVIIGSGPAGYTAGIYAARSMLKPLIITGPAPGGQLISTAEIENFPGFANSLQGYELMEKMKTQATSLGARTTMDSVETIDTSAIPYHVLTTSGRVYVANCLIIATGCVPKTLNLQAEAALKGNSVSVCATCDGFFYKNKNVAVVGGGNTAVTDAIYLSKIAKRVVLICKNEKLSCEKVLAERLTENGNVKVMYSSKVTKYVTKSPSEARIHGIQTSSPGGETSTKVDGVFIAIGTAPCTSAFETIGKNKQGYIITEANSTKTNVEGVFAAGDVNSSCRKQAVVAAASGCLAALEAEQFLCT
ncbi:FAD-dependent oxidoreductase [Candidatus Hodgkinia cicadicola]